MPLIYFILGPILLGILLYVLHMKATRLIALVAQTGLFAASVSLFLEARDATVLGNLGRFIGVSGITYNIGSYYAPLGIMLMADSLSAVFVMLTAFFFLVGTLYSFNESNSPLFWFLMFLWQSTLMGLFLSSDFFNIFVLLEIGTLVVSILIMFNKKNRSMYDGMLYLMVNVAVMQLYLFGLAYVYRHTGTLSIYEANRLFADVGRNYLVLPYALIMTFVVLKCAVVPLYSWLPKAHGTAGAPSAVSAILSGLHIKSSLYLFLRFQYTFEVVALREFFMVLGIITAIFGFLMAFGQKDLKLILAYHTISQVGLILTGFNLPGYYSYIGSLYHMINHALFKSALFLTGGIIAYAYGTRNIYEIKGVMRRMPLVGISALLAILGITGTPIFNGSISKYFIVSGIEGPLSWVLIFMSLGTIISFIKYARILFGDSGEGVKKVDVWQQVPVLVLGLLCFLGGIFGRQFIYFLFNVQLSVDPAGYLEKAGIFFASLTAGYLIFKYYVSHSKLIKKMGQLELGFRHIMMAIGIFFGTLLVFVGFVSV